MKQAREDMAEKISVGMIYSSVRYVEEFCFFSGGEKQNECEGGRVCNQENFHCGFFKGLRSSQKFNKFSRSFKL